MSLSKSLFLCAHVAALRLNLIVQCFRSQTVQFVKLLGDMENLEKIFRSLAIQFVGQSGHSYISGMVSAITCFLTAATKASEVYLLLDFLRFPLT
jgi:hypothetical protein